MSSYLATLLAEQSIDRAEYEALLPTGVLSAEELYATTLHFPSLAQALPGGNLARISALAARRSSMAFRQDAAGRLRATPVFARGATPPTNAAYRLGARAGGRPRSAAPAAAPTLAPLDHHTAWRSAGWPVRDQGLRGTCVAHAVAACKEALTFAGAASGGAYDASEQFLFWGAKQFDPSPADGTLHGYALKSLVQHGLCDEHHWPYDCVPGTSVDHGPPPAQALAAAAANPHLAGGCTTTSGARHLYKLLAGGPVALGLPVFADPLQWQHDNWNVPVLLEYGRVMDPPPQSVVVGGHAVCVVGFVPDPYEPAGIGWFVVRNSWGTARWGNRLPAAGYHGPEPGYGQISWGYVDSYLWELCWLH